MAVVFEPDEFLPDCMKDFHDQKDIFKSIWRHCMTEEVLKDMTYQGKINWVMVHCFVVDKFLWFMAQHGYVLRRARHKRKFVDLGETVAEDQKERAETFKRAMGWAD